MNRTPSAQDYLEAAELIRRHFDVALVPREHASDDALGGLPELLTRPILTLLRDDLGRLTNILYRIDVPERDVEAAFQADTLEDVAAGLAERIVARELQTVAMRRTLTEGDET